MIEAVNTYVEKEKNRLVAGSEKTPAKTILELKSFSLQVRTMDCEKEMTTLYNKLKKDRYINALVNVMVQVGKVQVKIAKKGTAGKSDTKALAKYKASLQKMIDSEKTPEVVKKEATEFKDSF